MYIRGTVLLRFTILASLHVINCMRIPLLEPDHRLNGILRLSHAALLSNHRLNSPSHHPCLPACLPVCHNSSSRASTIIPSKDLSIYIYIYIHFNQDTRGTVDGRLPGMEPGILHPTYCQESRQSSSPPPPRIPSHRQVITSSGSTTFVPHYFCLYWV